MIINLSTTLIKAFGLFLWGLFLSLSLSAKKVSPSVIVASIEGEVSSLNMVDDFKVQMDSSSVGKKINPKTLLNTGKTGKIALLFSNGTLITIKPGSRFYLRTYKQLEGVVEGLVDPGKLEEEPTQSELSGHLDYGDLVVKAPKLKKGSSMKLTSPLGVAGIRGTMFQLMAVRNSVTGDIMGGVNLISGDIDFTDTGGNMVTLLSGQSIQLATSKLGAPVASMTGELVDLSSTYGPALTEGFSPPPPEAIFPSLSESSDSDEDSEDSESGDDSFDQSSGNVASAGGNFDFIHQMASEIFFEIEEAESSSSEFSFDSMAMAPTVDIPTPEVQAPAAPASVTGETETGEAAVVMLYPPPQITFNEFVDSSLLKSLDSGNILQVEIRANGGWEEIDPNVVGKAFTGYELEVFEDWTPSKPEVLISKLSSIQQDLLLNAGTPGEVIELNSYSVNYSAVDNANLGTNKQRTIQIKAERPSIEVGSIPDVIPASDPTGKFETWKQTIEVKDVRGNILPYSEKNPNVNFLNGYYFFDVVPDLNHSFDAQGQKDVIFNIQAVDWRGVKSEKEIRFLLKATDAETSGTERLEPELSNLSLKDLDPKIYAFDEFGQKLDWPEYFKLLSISPREVDPSVDTLGQLADKDYLFTYLVTDDRGVGVEETRTVRVKASGPSLDIPDFESKFIPYPANDYVSYSLEYKDPNGEFPVWLESVRGINYRDEDNLTDLISVNDLLRPAFFGEFLDDQDEKTSFSATEGRHEIQRKLKLKFQIVDDRFKEGETHPDWKEHLTYETEKLITIFVTPPSIDEYNSTIGVITMDDPNNKFGNQLDGNGEVYSGWVSSIKVKDVNGSTLPFRENPGTEKGIFYLSPMPDLFSQGVTNFRIIARDWRGIETKSEQLSVEVKATSPFIEGVEEYVVLEEELSAEALSTIDPMITAEDEFGNSIIFGSEGNASISLVRVIGPNSETPQTRIDQLEKNFLYVLDYEVTDSRGISSTVKRYLQIIVTPPTITGLDFQSQYQFGTAKDSNASIEYTDPEKEYSAWLNGITAYIYDLETNQSIEYSSENFSKAFSSIQVEQGYAEPTSIEELFNAPGSYDLNFTIVDPRYEDGVTNEDWKNDLTYSASLGFEVIVTKPSIEQLKELPQIIPMEDPGGAFKNWLEAISVVDLEKTPLVYDQNASEGARFYLDPLPDLDPGFAYPNEETASFEIVAIDSRGVEKRSDFLEIVVKATGAEITGSQSLTFELSDSLLNDLDPGITAVDEFNNSIPAPSIVLKVVSPGDYDGLNRLDELDQLSDGQTYTLTYQITDYRGVMVEENRYLTITATPPNLNIIDFQSEQILHPSGTPHAINTIEYKDPWSELSAWLSSVTAIDIYSSSLSDWITLQINGLDYTDFTSSAPDLEEGENVLTFQVIDPRFIAGETSTDWLDDLTTEISHSITVVVTPPSFDEINSTSSLVQEVDGRDWLAELDPWIGSIIARDVRGVEIDSSGIQLVSSPDITVVGNYDLNYTITDWRGIGSSISRSVQVIKTPPTLTITNGGWRNDLTFDENGTIEYMVKPVAAYLDFDNYADDGEFTILPTSSSTESRKVYVQALGYDGTNISDAITVGNIQINDLSDSVVDYSILGSTQLDISIDDSLFRNFDSNGNGAVVSLTPTVEIVDKLGPYIQLPDGLNPLSIVGISNQAFPVPRVDIIDNLDSQTAIENNLLGGSVFQYDSVDHTDYPDENLWIGSNVPGIAENEILMFSGFYEDYITFQAFEDLSGNEMRNSDVTLDVNVTDSVLPIVTLRGGDPLYVDLNATISGTETFVDPGLQIVENLYVHELGETTLQLTDGSVIWDYADELVEKGMLVIEIQAFDENTSTYDAPLTGGETIENLLANYSAADGDASRYRLTYRFTDRAGNVGNEVTREIEFRNDPNDPSQVSFESTVSVVDDVYEVEAESITSSDLVNAFIQLATGPQYTSIANKEFLYVAADGNSTVDWSPELVNYHESESGDEFYVNDNRLSGGNLEFIPKDSEGLPKMVVRYSAYNEFGDLFQYSLEYRFKDTTAPNFDIITDSSIVGNIQTNIPYDDLGVQGFEDAYNDSKGQTHESLYSQKLYKDDIEFFGPASSDPFPHLEAEGFWTPGNYEVEYVVRDDFNNSRELRRSITVVDSIAPHMAMISHAFLNDTDTTLSSSFDQLSDNPSLPYDNTIFSSLDIIPTTSGSYYSEQDEDFDFILKLSEANQSITTIIQTPNPSTSVVKDNYGRSYAWHSAFEITLSNNEKFKDPGVYVENLSDYNITVSSSIEAVYGDGGQLVEVKVTYSAQQETDVQTNSVIRQDISASRSYTFLDEELPSITFSETATSVTGPYIMLEANNSWDDTDGSNYYFWDTTTFKSSSTEVLTISAWDAVDGEFPDSDIIKTITNISTGDSNTSISSASDFLDDIYEIKYEVTDTAGNTAEAFRYVIIKDTTAPTISWTFTDPYEVSNLDAEDVDWVKQRILDALNFSATDASDTQLSVSGNREKWSVSIDPEPTIDPSTENLSVYPYNQEGEGYDFNVTVTDHSGNSASIGPYELKIGDYIPPEITPIGDTEIHEFLRYGENDTDFANQTERLFDDQASSEVFPRTEFTGGAHRLMIANFSFADPGVWAEDQSFDPAVYPDLHPEGVSGWGESYAIQRFDDEADFLSIDENNPNSYTPGVIYSYSQLHTKSLKEWQDSFDAGFSGSEGNASDIDSDGDNVNEPINVHEVTIQYKVIDGWGNANDFERRVYIYQSQQLSDSAFYATPLWDNEGEAFPDLYDTNRSNDITPDITDTLPFITSHQKDYDGDGVSDYWENIFGSRPNDASHTPSNLGISLTDPGAYKTVLTQAPSIPE